MEKSLARRLSGSRIIRWVIGIPVALLMVLFIASYFLDEPLRHSMERKMNRNLKGYSVRLPGLHCRLIGLSLTLKGLTVTQLAHPDTPVVSFPVLNASIHWREILSGRLVAEFLLEQPNITINLQQLRSEAANTVPLKERGWQQAVEAIYPLKINSLNITDATITYIDQDPKRPLVLSHLNLQANNIRNIHQPDQVYPSQFHLDTTFFDTGHATINGAANFLAAPHPGIKGHITLEKIAINNFKSMISNANLTIQGGELQADGDAEYAPKVKKAYLKNLTIRGMDVEYVHSLRTADAEKKRAAAVKKNAGKISNNPDFLIRADQVFLTGCTFGFMNRATTRPFRIFLSDTDLHLDNVSNQVVQGPMQVRLKAQFMGNGATTATALFRPEQGGADFDLHLKIEDTRLTTMNDLLLAYGDFDVSAGVFALVTELHFKKGHVVGYFKPFFKDMKVYDRKKDKKRGISHQLYEMMVGGVATVLENRSHQEVATRVDIKGSVNKPEIDSWQIVTELFRNAFFKAILPGFEKR